MEHQQASHQGVPPLMSMMSHGSLHGIFDPGPVSHRSDLQQTGTHYPLYTSQNATHSIPQPNSVSQPTVPSPMTMAPARGVLSLLMKDPEITSKVWAIEVSPKISIAGLAKMFLLKRNGECSQGCQLRIHCAAGCMTEELDRTVEDWGVVRDRTLLHCKWKASAAGCQTNNCQKCAKIARADVSIIPSMNLPETGVSKPERKPAEILTEKPRPDTSRSQRRQPTRRTPLLSPSSQEFRSEALLPTTTNSSGLAENPDLDVQAIGKTLTVDFLCQLERLAATAASATDVVGKLERLTRLYENQTLTGEEFSQAKRLLLGLR